MCGLKIGFLFGVAVSVICMTSQPSFAQANKSGAKTDKVVATVNGLPIRESDIATAGRDLGPALSRVNRRQHIAFIVQYLVERYLLAEHARKAKISKTAEYKKYAAFYNRKSLRDAFVDRTIAAQVTEADMKATYDKAVEGLKKKPETRARHILVKTEKEAKVILAELKKGAKFDELAKKKSIGPSKSKGGDLGFFARGAMVPEFDKVAFKLKKGEISQPVKTQFGWHVIKSEGYRTMNVPPFERVKPTIRLQLMREKVNALAATLRKDAKIEILFQGAKPGAPKPAPQQKKK